MNVTLPEFEPSPEALGVTPLTWTLDDRGDALVCCANGHLGSIRGHEIDAAGTVTPSILCATPMAGGSDCGWHVFATLQGWTYGPREGKP